MELSEEDTLIEVRQKKIQMHKKQHSYIRIHKKNQLKNMNLKDYHIHQGLDKCKEKKKTK